MKRVTFLGALLLLGGRAAIHAQIPDATPAGDNARAALVAALGAAHNANRLVRMHLTDRGILLGGVGEVTGSFARVAAQPVDLDRVDSVEVRFTRPDPVREGVAIGAVAGVGLGYLGALLAAGLSEGNAYTKGDALRAVAIGAGVGALFGALVDAGLEGDPQWRTVWRRRDPPASHATIAPGCATTQRRSG